MTNLPMRENLIDHKGNLVDPYQGFIAVSKYSRWLDSENRRETWAETVNRFVDWMRDTQERRGVTLAPADVEDVRHAIMYQHVMPSMRALMTAGPAADRNHISIFNCSFLAVDSVRSFDEALLVLMHGTGVGFSVENKYVDKLPEVAESFHKTTTVVNIEDSKEGWAKGFKEWLTLLWSGQIPTYDVSKVRPKGSRLKVFGGRASGPEPLVDLFEFSKDLLINAVGRRITNLEAHDLMCKVAEIVVVGGVRRSALVSLSDLGSRDMAEAKAGAWWMSNPQRALANNSAVYTKKPNMETFFREWKSLHDSKSGERGIFNLKGAREHVETFGRRDTTQISGGNPCMEILLRDKQFCNLTEVVVHAEDTKETLLEKVRIATILGTWQASLTNFKYLRKKWKDNTEEEALLGVSMTGIYGNTLTNGLEGESALIDFLNEASQVTIEVNEETAEEIGINPSAALRAIKPSGTVSQLTGVSSGLHPWHAAKYIRRVRSDNKDPLCQLMKDAGVPNEPEINKPQDTTVFSFAIEAPEGAITQSSISAIQHLDMWRIYHKYWTDHNPSVTVTVEEDEWLEVGAYVYKHFDELVGVSFLPGSGGHTYQQAPYEEVSDEDFETVKAKMVSVDWNLLASYELEDSTSGSQELACTSGACEIVGLDVETK